MPAMTQFVALDFETANANRNSICSIGLVKVVNGEIVDTYYSLVNPGQPFDRRNIAVHGITPADVKKAPRFRDIHETVCTFMGGAPIVAHFAQFDIAVLRAALQENQLPLPSNPYFCSCMLAKSLLRLPSNKLNAVADFFGFSFKHHNAIEDARVCAEVVLQLAKDFPDVLSFLRSAGYSFGYIHGESFRKQAKPASHPFYKKTLAFTSDLTDMNLTAAAKTVGLLAGILHPHVQEKTDYVIVSEIDAARYRNKQPVHAIEQAKIFQAAGSAVKIVSETKFFQTIGR